MYLGYESIYHSVSVCSHRKYKDYIYGRRQYRSTRKNKEYPRSKDKAQNDMMYQDIYNCICQNTKKLRYTIQYVKPTAQLVFKIWFPKGGPTCRRQAANPRHQTSQGQSTSKPETPLQNIQAEQPDATQRGPMAPCWIRHPEKKARDRNTLGDEGPQNTKYPASKCCANKCLVLNYYHQKARHNWETKENRTHIEEHI